VSFSTKQAFEEPVHRIKFGGKTVNAVRFADGKATATLTGSEKYTGANDKR